MKRAISSFIIFSVLLISMSILPWVSNANTLEITISGVTYQTISTAAEFSSKISAAPTGNFALISDIFLDQFAEPGAENYYSPIENFSGKLVGFNEERTSEEQRIITIEASAVGLFKNITDATVKNIKIQGNITNTVETSRSSPFAGVSDGTVYYENCINEASVNVRVPSGGAAGGFIGYNNGVLNFRNCVNEGDLYTYGSTSGLTHVSGFCGGTIGKSASKPTFENCVNNGDITSVTTSSHAAGLICIPKAISITNCSNTGNISAGAYAGGFTAGSASGGASIIINKSFNAGNISASNASSFSAAVQYPKGSAYFEANDSYNIGLISGSSKTSKSVSRNGSSDTYVFNAVFNNCYDASLTSGVFADADIVSTNNCYYLSETSGEEVNGLKPLTINEAKKENFEGFDFLQVWEDTGSFPKLKDNILLDEPVFNPGAHSFYDQVNATSYIFAIADTEATEYGIYVNGNYYPSAFKSSDGKFGISLKDITAKLGDTYKVKVYQKYNDKYFYSKEEITFDTGIIFANPENISEAVSKLAPGKSLLLEDGLYSDTKFKIEVSGTEHKPVIVRSRNKGKAEFTGESQIHINGSYVTVSDILFNECLYDGAYEDSNVIALSDCTKSRVTGCAFITCGHTGSATHSMLSFRTGAIDCRVDHNLFKDSRALSIVLSSNNLSNEGNAPVNNRIDHNYFCDIKKVADLFPNGDGNGFECIQLAYGDIETMMGTIVEYNRFENVIGDGGEIISNKSSGNIYRYNTFVNCNSGPTLRNGNNCVFEGNFLINMESTRVFSKGHLIKNNYFYKSLSLNLDTAYDNVNDEGYIPQSDSIIEGNVFIEPTGTNTGCNGILTGKFFNTINMRNLIPVNVSIKDNYFYLRNGRAIFNYVTNPYISYEGNKAVLTGESSFGVSEGFEEVSDELLFDGFIYYPKNKVPDKQGLMLLKDKKEWWMSLTDTGTDKFVQEIPGDKTPVSYSASATSLNLKSGDSFDAGYLVGTATFEDGTTYKPEINEVTFKESSAYCVIENGKIKLTNATTDAKSFKITSTYKGCSATTTIYVYPDGYYNSQTGDYYDFNGKIPIYKNGGSSSDFASSDGVIYSSATGATRANAGTVVANLYTTDEDFELTMDVTVKKSTENEPKVHILLGFREYFDPHFVAVNLYNGGGVQSYQNYALLGECWDEGLKLNTKQNVKIVKRGNILVSSVDGKILTIAEIPNSLEGKVSFKTEYADLRVENINLYKKTYKDEEISDIPLTFERIDENMIRIKTTSINDSYIYRFIKNGQYKGNGDAGCDYVEGSVKLNTDYRYEVYAYDSNGVLRGKGEIDINLPPSGANEFFKISNIMARAGANGEYVSTYDRQNRFLKQGSKAHCDRSWTFTYLAPEFYDSAILLTGNADRTNAGFVKYSENWLTFDINRSATVYVITYLTPKYLPWLNASYGWLQEENYIYQLDEEGNRVVNESGKNIVTGYKYFNISDCSNTYVYSKHFTTEDGVNLNIKLGGATNQVSSMYAVVIKPDVMPEPVEVLRKY